MKTWREEDIIEVLGCNFDARPDGPGREALAPFINRVLQASTTLTIEFDPAGREVAEAFVRAERVCCSNVDWKLQDIRELKLIITAEPQQILALRYLIPTPIEIEEVQ